MKENFYNLSRTFRKDIELRAFLAICVANCYEANDSLIIPNILFTTRKDTIYHTKITAKKAIVTDKGKELILNINLSSEFKIIIL